MSNMRRLVRIDVGVLEDDLAAGSGFCRGIASQEELLEERAALKEDVDIAGARDLNFGNAFDFANRVDNLGGHLSWRLAHHFGQLKAERKGKVTHLGFRGLFNDQLVQPVAIVILDMSNEALFDFFSQRQEHRWSSAKTRSHSETPNPSTLQTFPLIRRRCERNCQNTVGNDR